MFVSDRSGTRDLFRILPNGKGVYNLTRTPGDDTEPAYNADGQWLAFTSARNGNRDIFRMTIAGRHVQALTTHPDIDMHAQWHGDTIYFLTARDGDFHFYEIAADGQEQPAILPPIEEPPQKSPDGTSLVSTTTPGDIYLIRFESADRTLRLTDDAEYDCCAAWNPTGEWIVFESDRSGNRDLYRIRPDGTGLAQITRHPASDRGAVWLPPVDKEWHPLVGILAFFGIVVWKLVR
jgi:Tol biopolymer transport system component